MQTLVLGRAREKYDGLRGSAAAFVRQLVAAAAALHSHSLESCGKMHNSVSGFPLRFCQLHTYLFVSFLAKFLGVQDFSHTFSVASVVIINEGVVARLLCVWVPLCACERRSRESRDGTAFTK